jgi:hypothetical protein
MVKREGDQIIETPTEARQAEPGPSIFVMLTVSLTAVVVLLAIIWLIFFRT